MSDIVLTTGRRMTYRLQSALDDLTGANRRAAIRSLTESSGVLGPIHHALALELRLCDLREQDTLRKLAETARDDTDDPPYPVATGPSLTYDETTGTFIPDDAA